jgi:hypothetical protein
LTPAARRRAAALLASDHARQPFGYAAALDHEDRLRARRLGSQTLEALAAEAGVHLVAPFLDLDFQRALVAVGGRFGWVDRTDLLLDQFPDVLPADVLRRRSKATFNGVYFTECSREAVRRWNGALPDGVRTLVDAQALRREWQKERPQPSTFGLLQAVCLAAPMSGAL